MPLEPTQNWATFYDKINIGYLKIVKTIPNYVFRNPKSQYRWVTFDIAPELLQAEGAEPPDVAPHSKCISTWEQWTTSHRTSVATSRGNTFGQNMSTVHFVSDFYTPTVMNDKFNGSRSISSILKIHRDKVLIESSDWNLLNVHWRELA